MTLPSTFLLVFSVSYFIVDIEAEIKMCKKEQCHVLPFHCSDPPSHPPTTTTTTTADTDLHILKDYAGHRLRRLWQVTDMNRNVSPDISHISFPLRPFISVLWEDTSQSISQGSAGLFSLAGFGFSSSLRCRSPPLCSTSFFKNVAIKNNWAIKLKLWFSKRISGVWFIKQLVIKEQFQLIGNSPRCKDMLVENEESHSLI